MNHTLKTLSPGKTATVVAVTALLALSGCTGGGQEDNPPPSSKSAAPAPANPGASEGSDDEAAPAKEMTDEERERIEKEMTPGDVSDKQLDAIRSYLEVRENSESTQYKDVDEWKSAMKKVTTGEGLKTALESYQPEESSNARMVAEDNDYKVSVAVGACTENPGFGGGKDSIAVQCEMTDLVKTDDGLVPSQDVDNTWPYFGEQQQPTLVVAKDGDKWLVDGDYTGKAS